MSALLGQVPLAMTFYTDQSGKQIGPGIWLDLATALLLSVATACGYVIVRAWTGLAWAFLAARRGEQVTAVDGFWAVRGQCLAAGAAYGLGVTLLAWILVALAPRSGVDEPFRSIIIAAGPSGLLAPVALVSAARVRRMPAGPAQPASAQRASAQPASARPDWPTTGRLVALSAIVLACGEVGGWAWSGIAGSLGCFPISRGEYILAIGILLVPGALAVPLAGFRAWLLAPLATGAMVYSAAATWVAGAVQMPPSGWTQGIAWAVLLAPTVAALIALAVAARRGSAGARAETEDQSPAELSGNGIPAESPPRGSRARPSLLAAGAVGIAALTGYLVKPVWSSGGVLFAVMAASLLSAMAAGIVVAAAMEAHPAPAAAVRD